MYSYNKIKSQMKSVCYVLLALVVLVVSEACAQIISNFCLELFSISPKMVDLIYSVVYMGVALALGLICIKYIFHFSPEDIGMKKSFPEMKWIFISILLPVGVSAFYFINVDGNLVKNNSLNLGGLVSTVITAVLVTGISAGAVEEFIFRGLIMKIIDRAWGRSAAIFLPAFLFSILHLSDIRGQALGDTFLLIAGGTSVGIMFALIRYHSGSIWASAIVHALWNIIMIGDIVRIYSVDSGRSINAIYYYQLNEGSLFVTGGYFGIEAALPAIVGYWLVSAIIIIVSIIG